MGHQQNSIIPRMQPFQRPVLEVKRSARCHLAPVLSLNRQKKIPAANCGYFLKGPDYLHSLRDYPAGPR